MKRSTIVKSSLLSLIFAFAVLLTNMTFALSPDGCEYGINKPFRVRLCVSRSTVNDTSTTCGYDMFFKAESTDDDPLQSVTLYIDDKPQNISPSSWVKVFLEPGFHHVRAEAVTKQGKIAKDPRHQSCTIGKIQVTGQCDLTTPAIITYSAKSGANNLLNRVELSVLNDPSWKRDSGRIRQDFYEGTATKILLIGENRFQLTVTDVRKISQTVTSAFAYCSNIDLHPPKPDCPIGGGEVSYSFSAHAAYEKDKLSSVKVYVDGNLSFDSDAIDVQDYPPPDFIAPTANLSPGDHTFKLTADSQNGVHAESPLQLVHCGASPDAIDDVFYMDQDTSLDIKKADFLANDVDPDGDILTVTEFNPFPPGIGTWVDHGDGSYTYTPPPGFVGSLTGTYSISDGNGGTDTANAVLYVQAVATQVPPPTQPPAIVVPPTSEPPTPEPPTPEPVNQPPVANPDSFSVKAGESITVSPGQLLSNDSDPDGDGLTIVDIHSTSGVSGHDTRNPDGSVTFTAPANFSGVMTGEYTISDGHDHTASATITLTVNP